MHECIDLDALPFGGLSPTSGGLDGNLRWKHRPSSLLSNGYGCHVKLSANGWFGRLNDKKENAKRCCRLYQIWILVLPARIG